MDVKGFVAKVLTALLISAVFALFQMWSDVQKLKLEQQQILDNYADYIRDQMTKPCEPTP